MTGLRLFTPGPVPIEEHLRDIGGQQIPYHRTEAFSEFTHELLRGLEYVFQTKGSVALLTSSGTAAMEAAVLNFLSASDKVLIINGGTFGQRWCDLCDVHSVPYQEYPVPLGGDIDPTHLDTLLADHSFTALLVNAHETSTGHLYDVQGMGDTARRHDVFFIVDAIASICADPFFMDEWHVDVALLSSQKALALPPGLSFVAMNQRAIERLATRRAPTLYFNLGDYLANQKRGQLPYTPAIGLMMQLHQRLHDIQQQTLSALVRTHRERAASFRQSLDGLPFKVFPFRPSNAMTALTCDGLDASRVVEELRARHHIVVAPNSGALKAKVFRIAHMGAQTDEDLKALVTALRMVAVSTTHPPTEAVIT